MEPDTDTEPAMHEETEEDEMHKQKEEDEMHKDKPRPLALDAEQEQTVHALARSMSQTSDMQVHAPHSSPVLPHPHLHKTATRGSHATHVDADNEKHPSEEKDRDGKDGKDMANPFAGEAVDETLDPLSERFDMTAWLKSVMHIASRDPENFPRRTAGVSFRNLNVHGVGSPTDYKKTVGNVWLEAVSAVRGVLGMGDGKRKIQILRDFDGLVKSGELLVVLGRPGSGCSTFLKTIAGLTHGFTVAPTSDIQYQGIPARVMHKDFRGEGWLGCRVFRSRFGVSALVLGWVTPAPTAIPVWG
ncbi:ABC-transporter extracellular N-terminal-domain-containing protein [Mycena polygramma]|nr:ABC-transporter extracellular N-terminal-domain-containing protein [Mycena polygramma]